MGKRLTTLVELLELTALAGLTGIGLGIAYYVDATNGSDLNRGYSPGTAWKTIAKVNAATLGPDNRVLFKRGETWSGQLTIPGSGEPDHPLTFSDYGNGLLPVIDGTTYCISCVSRHDIEVANLHLTGSADDAAWFDNCDRCVIDGCEVQDSVTNADRAAIYFNRTTFGAGYGYNTISNCHIMSGVQGDGIYVRNQDSCAVTDNVCDTVNGTTADNIQLEGCQHYTITGNALTLLGTDSPKGNIIAEGGSNGYIAHNVCLYGNHGIAVNDSDVVVEFNYTYHHQTATWSGGLYQSDITTDNVVWRYNLSEEDQRGVTIDGASSLHTRTVLYNNTIVNFVARGISINKVDGECKNNIVRGPTASSFIYDVLALSGQGAWVSDYNDFGPEKASMIRYVSFTYNTLAAYVAAESQDAHSLASDPQFVSATDFHLLAASPCRNAGVDVGLSEDYGGVSVPRGTVVDIGAYEFVE